MEPMTVKIRCLALVCLLLAGCTGLGSPSQAPGKGRKLFPGQLGALSSRESFTRAVDADPFPEAGHGDAPR